MWFISFENKDHLQYSPTITAYAVLGFFLARALKQQSIIRSIDMENLISEFKVIETDDGFRIEIKGDKEKIKSLMKDFRGHRSRRWRGWRRPHWGPYFGFHPMMWMWMNDCWGPWDYEVKEEPVEETV
jgi:hypothetical protein